MNTNTNVLIYIGSVGEDDLPRTRELLTELMYLNGMDDGTFAYIESVSYLIEDYIQALANAVDRAILHYMKQKVFDELAALQRRVDTHYAPRYIVSHIRELRRAFHRNK